MTAKRTFATGAIGLMVALMMSGCALLQSPLRPNTPGGATSSGRLDSNARYVDPRELAANAQAFEGQRVIVQGELLNVTHNDEVFNQAGQLPSFTWSRIQARARGGSGAESVVIEFYPQDKRLTANQCYRISGTVIGTQEGPASIPDAPRRMPRLRGTAWESSPRDGASCAAPT